MKAVVFEGQSHIPNLLLCRADFLVETAEKSPTN